MSAAFLAAASAAAAQTDRMEGPEIGDRVRRDLGTLFQPGGSLERSYGATAKALGSIRTRPYATMVTAVCRMDEVIVSYAGREAFGGGVAENASEPFAVAARPGSTCAATSPRSAPPTTSDPMRANARR
jgi:hypothetical protein